MECLHLWEIAEYMMNGLYVRIPAHFCRQGGFYMERWGDAPVHSLAVAMLLNSSEVISALQSTSCNIAHLPCAEKSLALVYMCAALMPFLHRRSRECCLSYPCYFSLIIYI